MDNSEQILSKTTNGNMLLLINNYLYQNHQITEEDKLQVEKQILKKYRITHSEKDGFA